MTTFTKKPRYELRTGKFGQCFYDVNNECDLPLTDVLGLLNSPAHIGYEVICADLEGTRRELAKYMKLAEDRARKIDDLHDSLRAAYADLVEYRNKYQHPIIKIQTQKSWLENHPHTPGDAGYCNVRYKYIVNEVEGVCEYCGVCPGPDEDPGRTYRVVKLENEIKKLTAELEKLHMNRAEVPDMWTTREKQWVEWAEKIAGYVDVNITDTTLQQLIEDLLADEKGKNALNRNAIRLQKKEVKTWREWAEKVAGFVGINIVDTTDITLQQSIENKVNSIMSFEPTPQKINALPYPLRKYIHDLETRCDPAGDCAGRVLAEDESATYALRISRLNVEVNELRVHNRHLTNKLACIVEYIGSPFGDVTQEIYDIATEQLSSYDPAMIEIERATMMAEIDKTLKEAGAWVGGRLDSIRQLIEMTKPSWGAGDEYVANLREQWGQIDNLVANSIGRTPEKSLVYDVGRLANFYLCYKPIL